MDAAGRAAKDFGAQIVLIKKTSAEYAHEKHPCPCPSVLVNGRIIARNAVATYEALKQAIRGTPAPEGRS